MVDAEDIGASEKSCPAPARGTVSGLPEILFAIFRIPVRLPSAAGVKLALIVQLAPAARLPTQLSVSAKSEAFVPLVVTLVMLSVVD